MVPARGIVRDQNARASLAKRRQEEEERAVEKPGLKHSGNMRKGRSDIGRHHASEPSFLSRQDSASQGKWSNDVISVVESGTVDEVRVKLTEGLLNCPESLLVQSMRNEHVLRTPLMAAAASGDFALFTAVMHAVDRAIRKRAGRKYSMAQLETKQLTTKDNWGMTLAMVAAQSGMVPIIRAVLRRIGVAKDYARLLDTDYRGTTVLMHAAGAGKSATFDSFLQAIQSAFSDEEVEEQLRSRSGNGWNILMHAARCGDQLGVTAVINACRINLFPSKVRDLVEEVDGDGMTFLMHAATGARTRPADAEHRATALRQRREAALQQTPTPGTKDPSSPDYTRPRGMLSGDRFHGIAEEVEEGDVEAGGPRARSRRSSFSIGDLSAARGDARAEFTARFGTSTPQIHPAASWAAQDDEDSEYTADSSRRSKGMMDPSLVVFKTAWAMVAEVLWKEQVRQQLKLSDSWGRNILIHAVQSGRVQVFEAAFNAIREHILDPETNKLMNVDYEDNTQSIMETALDIAPKDMVSLVARRDQELKKSIAEDERASTIEAKMQSFIPGKLIVIFQLLLPETGAHHKGALILLLVLTAVAPLLTWATTLVGRDKPPAVKDARHSKMTNLLSAPAIFFWGIGTSDIGFVTLGWSKTSSAAALAVATIVIPGLDAFFANQRVEQWFDKWSCQSWRFAKKANYHWVREKKKMKEHKEYRERQTLTPGAKYNRPRQWAFYRFCQTRDPTVGASLPVRAPSQPYLLGGNSPPAGTMDEEEQMLGTGETQRQQDTAVVVPATSVPAPSKALLGGDGNAPPSGAATGAAVEEDGIKVAVDEKEEADP